MTPRRYKQAALAVLLLAPLAFISGCDDVGDNPNPTTTVARQTTTTHAQTTTTHAQTTTTVFVPRVVPPEQPTVGGVPPRSGDAVE